MRDGERCWIVRLPEIFLLESGRQLHTGPFRRRETPYPALSQHPRRTARSGDVLKWIKKVEIGVGGGLLVMLRGGRTIEMSRRQSARLREVLSL